MADPAASENVIVETNFFVDQSTALSANPREPAVTTLANGNYVVAWTETNNTVGLSARIYRADGTIAVSEFVLESTSEQTQQQVTLTALPSGGFIAVWSSNDVLGADTSGYGIRARVFSESGVAVGNDYVINTAFGGAQTFPQATVLSDGRILVTWTSADPAVDNASTNVTGRILNADGSPSSQPDFVINNTYPGGQSRSYATALDDGGFVVVYQTTNPDDGSSSAILARAFNGDGTARGDASIVNTTTAGPQTLPVVTALEGGGFVVAYGSNPTSANSDIEARIYKADGTPLDDSFIVNATTDFNQTAPSITALPDGRFMVAWHSAVTTGTTYTVVRGQLFEADGTAVGDEFRINTQATTAATNVKLTTLADGSVIATWQGGSVGEVLATKIIVPTTEEPNSAPTGLTLTGDSVAENSDDGTVVGTLSATDADGDTLTYSLTDNAGDKFSLITEGNVTKLVVNGPLDFETATSHSISIKVIDGNGGEAVETFTIGVTDVDETPPDNGAPTDLAISSTAIKESARTGFTVGTLSANDPEGGAITWSLVAGQGDNNDKFDLKVVGGETRVVLKNPLDHEASGGVYDLVVRATDSHGNFTDKLIQITAEDEPFSISGVPTGKDYMSVIESAATGTQIGFISDYDYNDAFKDLVSVRLTDDAGGMFSITSGFTYDRFSGTNVAREFLTVNGDLDFESNDEYSVTIEVTAADGSTRERTIDIHVADAAEGTDPGIRPEGTITIDADTALAASNGGVNWNTYLDAYFDKILGNLPAFYPDGSGWSATNPATEMRIQNNTSDGTLISIQGTDFFYNWADPVSGEDVHVITGTITDVVFGSGGPAPQYELVDPELTISGLDLSNNADPLNRIFGEAQIFTQTWMYGNTSQPSDIEFTKAILASYAQNFKGSSAGDTYTGTIFADTMAGNGGADTLAGGGGNDNIDGGDGSDIAIYGGDEADYTVTDNGDGTWTVADNRAAAINDGSDTVKDVETLQFADGTLSLVADNAAPTGLSLTGNWITENAANGTVVGVLSAVDADGDVLTYTLTDDAGGKFALAIENGVTKLVVNGALDYETATNHQVTVKVSDGASGEISENFTVKVADLGEGTPKSDFVISGGTASTTPDIVTLSNGNFVVAWQVGGTGVAARIYDENGAPVSPELAIETTSTGTQTVPTLVALSNGGFIAVWQSDDKQGADTVESGIRGRVFSADGTPVGSDFIVNTSFAGTQSAPTGTVLSDGRILLTWSSGDGQGSDNNSNGIRSIILNADGSVPPGATDSVINTVIDGAQTSPSVTALEGGGYVVAWTSGDTQGTDNNLGLIRATQFDASGTVVGTADFEVNTTGPGAQSNPKVAALDDGGYVVTWASSGDIRARVFEADGTPVAEDFLVNNTVDGSQLRSDVTVLEDGRIFMVWSSTEGTPVIRGRVFEADGTAIGNDFVINDMQGTTAAVPMVSALDGDSVAVTWRTTLGGISTVVGKTLDLSDYQSNDAPTNLALSANSVAENSAAGTVIGTLSATDANGDALTYTLTDNANGKFALVTENGVTSLVVNGALDYEAFTSHSIAVKVADGKGGETSQTFTINVSDVEEALPDTPAGTITVDASGSSGINFESYVRGGFLNGTSGTGMPVFDNSGNFSGEEMFISYGSGATSKYVLMHGNLTYNFPTHTVGGTASTIQYGTRGAGSYDSNGYFVGGTAELTISGLNLSNAIPANASEEATIEATGPIHNFATAHMYGASGELSRLGKYADALDGYAQIFVSSSGNDIYAGTRFGDTIKASAGNDTFDGGDGNDVINFSGAKAGYVVATGAGGAVTITHTASGAVSTLSNIETAQFTDGMVELINPNNKAPANLQLSASTVSEDADVDTVIGTLSATDADGDTLTYSLDDDAGGHFKLVTSGGITRLVLASTVDFETAESHSVTVKVSDGKGGSTTQTFAIAVEDVENEANTAPTGLALSNASVAENVSVGAVVGQLSAVDAEGDDIAWSLSGGGGKFALATSDGVTRLVVSGNLDFETRQSYNVTLTASDGELSTNQTFTISVTDAADVIQGGGGSETLTGDKTSDVIRAGAGNDALIGGGGADRLVGGGGADTFIFSSVGHSKPKAFDTITDFKPRQGDIIDLSGIDANKLRDGNQSFDFIGRDDFSDKAGELRFEKSDGRTILEGDVNGDGNADFVLHLLGSINVKEAFLIL